MAETEPQSLERGRARRPRTALGIMFINTPRAKPGRVCCCMLLCSLGARKRRGLSARGVEAQERAHGLLGAQANAWVACQV